MVVNMSDAKRIIKDLPIPEAIRTAQQFMDEGWEVHFKYTCEQCGERCVLDDPNTIYESGECCVCGHITKLEKVGMLLILHTPLQVEPHPYMNPYLN